MKRRGSRGRRRQRRARRKKRKGPIARAAEQHRGGTEFQEHVKIARKLVKKLRQKVAALGRRSRISRKRKR
jgi:hypothetical protein